MRYPASEKLEIIRLVEQSHLPVRRTLAKLGIPKTTFYRWYDRYQAFGDDGLEDRRPHPGRVWNRIPDGVRQEIVDFALEEPELSPRELSFRFTDTRKYFVSEPTVYRILKAYDLITSPAFNVIKGETISAIGPRTMVERRVPRQDREAKSAVADGLHLPEGHRLGLVLSLHDPGRLQPIHRGVEALHHHEGRG